MHIAGSIAAYEDFLRQELGAEVVEAGLEEKRKAMRASPFAFLRASFWRWAEIIGAVAPELMDAPPVLAVGDVHLENFGTWRDADGRLVWGINDVDEAAEMPYALDLLRLLTSALLTTQVPPGPDVVGMAEAILEGYRAGLAAPKPRVLDREFGWLRALVAVPDGERDRFWEKLEKKRRKFEKQAEEARPALWPRYRAALLAALPSGAEEPRLWYRSAGLGSLGRPRWVAEAAWCGELVIREAKGIVPSAWSRRPGQAGRAIRCMEIASGRHRAPDPWYRVVDGVAVRRLSPNNRKITVRGPASGGEEEGGLVLEDLLQPRLLSAMGMDLAAIHGGASGLYAAIDHDLARRKPGWLAAAAERAASAVQADYAALPA